MPIVSHADDPIVPLTVERLTFGPDALARADGQVVFVPFAAPGDEIARACTGGRAAISAPTSSRSCVPGRRARRRPARPSVAAADASGST
jgi:tRNA/tmRNA/rRNA uracil-C5-methylase (TrmA/RlmC/RlmD family)